MRNREANLQGVEEALDDAWAALIRANEGIDRLNAQVSSAWRTKHRIEREIMELEQRRTTALREGFGPRGDVK